MSSTPCVSVLLPTHNRAEILRDTLSCLSEQLIDFTWELLVIDNACTDGTQRVLKEMQSSLPLRVLHEPHRGKSRALNLALTQATGELTVFTDDDVRPARKWLSEYLRASRKYPDSSVFCGPISPIFPQDTPVWLQTHSYTAESFGNFHPSSGERYLPPPLLPFGSNFAVRSTALQGMRMREDLGPSEESDLMSEDTDFLKRLRLRAPAFVFLPDAGVGHYLRREQIELPWLFERAFCLGRSLIVESDVPDVEDSPMPCGDGEAGYFECGMRINYHYGQLYQLSLSGGSYKGQLVLEAIGRMWAGDVGLLSDSARKWLSGYPGKIPHALRQTVTASLLMCLTPTVG